MRDFTKHHFCCQDSSLWISFPGEKNSLWDKNLKNTQTPKITGQDFKSNYFYWSSQARILLLLCRLSYLSTWLKWILLFCLKCTQNYKSMCKTEEAALQQGRKTRIKEASRFWSKPLECCRGRGIRSCTVCQMGWKYEKSISNQVGKKRIHW